jgi:hypothetical protein
MAGTVKRRPRCGPVEAESLDNRSLALAALITRPSWAVAASDRFVEPVLRLATGASEVSVIRPRQAERLDSTVVA